jgi:hypothetical protein
MTLSNVVKNRLINFKFEQAANRLTDEERETPEGRLVEQLGERYANPGWMNGSEGAFLWAILALLGVNEE